MIIPLKQEEMTEHYDFEGAFATQSRLMGVVGMRLHFTGAKNLVLFFHLDFEEYGVDRFEIYEGEDPKSIKRMTQSFMGGLGAKLIEIDKEIAVNMLYEAVDVGTKYMYNVPELLYDYEYLFEDIFATTYKWHPLCIKLDDVNSVINYYIMRTVALDYSLRDEILGSSTVNFELTDYPCTLLKNEITPDKDGFVCKSVIDYNDGYKMIISKIGVDHNKVVSAEVLESLCLTPAEAMFQLNRKEYILVYYHDNPDVLSCILDSKHPDYMLNAYPGGDLYTRFNKDNTHVKSSIYYLNGDVFGAYYTTNTNQVVVFSFEEEKLQRIKQSLTVYEMDLLVELEAQAPIVFGFVNSDEQDFLDYL